jgi:hypothetical protein
MLTLLLALGLQAGAAGQTPPTSSPAGADTAGANYSSTALRAFVARASERNRAVPPGLAGYQATIESEMAFVAYRGDGDAAREQAVQVEQVANAARWTRDGAYEQRVIGYRAQTMGMNLSTLSYFRSAWTVPVLYGNRLSLFFGRDTAREAERK